MKGWTRFGAGLAAGAAASGILVLVLDPTPGREAARQPVGRPEELFALESENRSLRLRLETSVSRIAQIEGKAARKQEPVAVGERTVPAGIDFFLEKYRARSPLPEVDLNLELADSLMARVEARDLPEHRAKIAALLRLHEGSPEGLRCIAKFLWHGESQGLFEDLLFAGEVRASLEGWAATDRSSPEPLLWLARLARGKGGSLAGEPKRQAESWLLDALRRDPEEGRASAELSRVCRERGDAEGAFRYGEEALSSLERKGSLPEAESERLRLGMELGDLALERSDAARALRHFQAARKLAADSPRLRNLPRNWTDTKLGLLYLRSGEREKAVEALRSSGEVLPDWEIRSGGMQLELAEALALQRETGETRKYLERVLQLTDSSSETYRRAKKLLEELP